VLEIASEDGHHTLVLAGDLDIASSWLLEHPLLKIRANGVKSFTLDLSGLTFIDSNGIRAVLAASGLCATRGCEFLVIPGSAQVQRVFEVAGLINRLPFSKRGAVVAETSKRQGTTPGKQSLDRLAARQSPLGASRANSSREADPHH
jgi:anti-anti-sigma factor